ncbi:hypothetical protein DXX92_18790 [Thalassotalea euphylliae]|uniref:Uncharacterized protein n=1 Tax=Thalassotalea euphylliae TaxID=1655234 RepID=A0A3E0ULN7_9GAMM|nr:hypothetical protein DXX92_18790 [Thalassotalea euphylliae]
MIAQLVIKRFSARRLFARNGYSLSKTSNEAIKRFSQAFQELFSVPVTAQNFIDVRLHGCRR